MPDNPVDPPAPGVQGAAAAPNPGHRPPPVQGIRPPQPLILSDTITENWRLFRQKWNNYAILSNLGLQERPYQVAMLLHTLGDEALRVYNSFQFDTPDEARTVDEILTKFEAFTIGEVNETMERYNFFSRNQGENESFENYYATVRNLSRTCNFCGDCVQSLIRDRIVLGVKNKTTQETLLKERNLTTDMAVRICKAAETSAVQSRTLRGDEEETVSKVYQSKSPHHSRPARPPGRTFQERGPRKCKFCLKVHIMKKELCPAYGHKCSQCHRLNHVSGSLMCKMTKPIRAVEVDYEDSDSEVSIGTVTISGVQSENNLDKPIMCEMIVNGCRVKMQVDPGATVCVLPKRYTAGLEVQPVPVNLRMWNSVGEKTAGKCKAPTINPATGERFRINFVVVERNLTPLLSRRAAETMGLVNVQYDKLKLVSATTTTEVSYNPWEQYPEVFDGGTGRLPGGTVHITLDDSAVPAILPPRRVPEALKPAVKAELCRLEETGMIQRVDEPTDWVSQMAVAEKKSGQVRICIDPRTLNMALKREHYSLPVLDDILPSLTKSDKFSVFDLQQGYLHCDLDDESSYLTTFATPFGDRYRWRKLPFGLKVSSEIFQKRLHQALDRLDGVHCIADDVIVHGKGDEHDTNVEKFLQRCSSTGVKLNPDKCQLGLSEIVFQGHIVSDAGLKADPAKIEAIANMPPPTDKEGVERLRGTVNYLARFVPKLTDVFYPISQLTHQDVEWNWSKAQDEAFTEVKRLISNAPALAYFDPSKQLDIQCDASNRGLGAALLQDGRPLAYASRALSDAESRYAVIEKEMLAVVFSLEKWHQYTYGRKVTIYSDHKPLESISRKPLDKAPRRLQGMLLRALAYDVEIKYLEGRKMLLADTLSRAHLPYDMQTQTQVEFESINSVAVSVSEDRAKALRKATQNDETLMTLKNTILEGWPEKSDVAPLIVPYFHFRDELTVCDGIVFRGDRVVIPQGMRQAIKRDIHMGHAGMDGCLRRARETVYWPGFSNEIKEWVQTCEACRAYDTAQNPKETLMSHTAPSRPWEKVGTDLFSWNGKDYLITVCYFSNYWEVDRLLVTDSKTVIKKLKGQFARYGVPSQVVSDNGPQFASSDFRNFSREWDFEHYTISPRHSQANGMVESAVKSAKRLLSKCKKSKSDPYLALLEWRNVPSPGIGSSPVQRLHGRRTRAHLPVSDKLLMPRGGDILDSEKEKMKSLKQKQAELFNRHAKDLPVLKTDDVVRMKPFRAGAKEWEKATVRDRLDERSYRVETPHGIFRRNRADLKKTMEPPTNPKKAVEPPSTPQRQQTLVAQPLTCPQTPARSPEPKSPVTRSPLATDVTQAKDTPVRSRSGRTIVKPTKLDL